MKQTLIIGSRNTGVKNDPSVITDSLTQRAVNASLIFWEDINFSIASNKIEVWVNDDLLDVSNIDLVIAVGWYKNGKQVIYRDIAYTLALFLDANGVEFWNNEMIRQRSTSKLSTMMMLALNGMAVPSTVASLSIKDAISRMTLPYVAKAAAASRGKDNYLITSQQQQSDLLALEVNLFLLQEYLENDHDLRVICADGKPQLVLRRSRGEGAETHLNNTSQGGESVWLDLSSVPHELLTFCEKVCKITGRELAGIDLIPDKNSPIGYSCLEVNAIPQLTSGTDIIKKMDALAGAIQSRKRV